MSNKNKIALIIPYFGKWPTYFNLFLKSVKRNTWIDVLFFSDQAPLPTFPENVKLIPFTLMQLKEALNKKIGVYPKIESTYKICDLRPSFGILFSEYLTKYTFWGWGDIDLIYGNLQKFIPSSILSTVDVISMRKNWVSGPFSLFRNSEKLNTLFMQNSDYKKVFTNPAHFSFSECGKQWDKLRNGVYFNKIDWEMSNMTLLVKQAEARGEIKCFFKDSIKESIRKNEYISYSSGLVANNLGVEYALYHFITEKRKPYFGYPNWENIPNAYYIDRFGFYLPEEFEKMNKGFNHFWKMIKAQPKFVKMHLERVVNRLQNENSYHGNP